MAVNTTVKTLGKVAMQGMNAYGNYSNYKSHREQGHGLTRTVASMAVETAAFMLAPEVMLGKLAADVAGMGMQGVYTYGQGAGRQNAKQVTNVYRHNFGGNFYDTQNAHTMRQRGLQAIQQSGYNINSVFGSEARTFYRGMR